MSDLIFSYSRAQALEDGILVDVSSMAKEAGFKYPTAITSAVYGVLSNIGGEPGQSFEGRLWDVLNVMRFTAADGDRVYFTVVIKIPGCLQRYKLYAVCGPGDTLDPVITIMEIGED